MNPLSKFFGYLIYYGITIGFGGACLYFGYSSILGGGTTGIVLGIVVISIGLLSIGLPIQEKIKSNGITYLFVAPILIILFSFWAILAIGVIILPFMPDTDLTVDLGVIIIKSGFVKFLLIIVDLFLIYYSFDWIKSFIKKKFNKE